MYLMYGDEADAEEGRGQKFFLYGAIFIEHSKAWTAHLRIEDLRKKAGFAAQDSLKFASSRPERHYLAGSQMKLACASRQRWPEEICGAWRGSRNRSRPLFSPANAVRRLPLWALQGWWSAQGRRLGSSSRPIRIC